MACLGGTWDDPRPWVRFDGGVPATGDTIIGRICDPKRMPWASTRRTTCHGCPAYRGKDWDGQYHGALAPDGETIQSLRLREYEQYVYWVEEEFEPERFYEYLFEGVRGISEEAKAAYMKRYRADNEQYREREREASRLRMRRYRERLRNRPAPDGLRAGSK